MPQLLLLGIIKLPWSSSCLHHGGCPSISLILLWQMAVGSSTNYVSFGRTQFPLWQALRTLIYLHLVAFLAICSIHGLWHWWFFFMPLHFLLHTSRPEVYGDLFSGQLIGVWASVTSCIIDCLVANPRMAEVFGWLKLVELLFGL